MTVIFPFFGSTQFKLSDVVETNEFISYLEF